MKFRLQTSESFYYKFYNHQFTAKALEISGIDMKPTQKIRKFIYRLLKYENGVRSYEIGECDNPRSHPSEWCDRRLCEFSLFGEGDIKDFIKMLK